MMSSIRDSDLKWMLGQLAPSESVQIAEQFMADRTRRPLSANPSCEDLEDLLATLRAREANTRREGIMAYGLEALIDALEGKYKSQKIIGFAFKTDQYFGKFYFEEREEKLIGFTIIDQHQKARQLALHPA